MLDTSAVALVGLIITAFLYVYREVKEEAGTYRMYLQGRPITYRLPEGYEQPTNPEPTPAPQKKLELDWVYPYCISIVTWCQVHSL